MPRNDPHVHDYDIDDWMRLKNVVDSYYKNAARRTHAGTWKAICLHSVVEYYEAGDVPNASLSVELGRPVGMIAVCAKIPELDGHIPWPKQLGDIDALDEEDQLWFELHRIFYGSLSGRYGVSEIPAPGDIIEVDFDDRTNMTGNIYIGVIERGIGIVPDLPSEGATEEASSLFSSPGATPATLSEYSAGSKAMEQTQQMDEEYNKMMEGIGAEMAEDLNESAGVRDDIASAWVDETLERE